MNQYLAERLACNTGFVLGENNERLPFIIELLGEQLHDIYMEQKTIDQFGVMLLQLEKDSERKKIINAFSIKVASVIGRLSTEPKHAH